MQYIQLSTPILRFLGWLAFLLGSFSQPRCPGGDCRPAEPLPPSLLAGLHGRAAPLRLKLLLREAG